MDEVLLTIKTELEKHCGKGNEVSAGSIEKMLGYQRDDTHAKGRKLIKECAKAYNIPLAANNKGYYLITTDEELNEYKLNLHSRREEIEERERIMKKNYREWKK